MKKKGKERKGRTTTTAAATTHSKQQQNKQQQNKQQPQQQQQQQQQQHNNKKNNNSQTKTKRSLGNTKTRPTIKNKWPSCLQIAHDPKSGRKLCTAKNAIELQKQAFQKMRTQDFAKCRKKAFFIHTNIFYIGTCAIPLAQCDLKKTYFYKGSTQSNWDRAQLARAQIQVCVFTNQNSCPMGCAIYDFWPILLLPRFSSEMPSL